MKNILSILSIFYISFVFSQDSKILVENTSITDVESHEIKITNDSDSLLCIFFSGFHGRHNATHFKLPVIDSLGDLFIYKLDFAKADFTIDAQCKLLQVLTIQAHQSKTITVDILKNPKKKKIDFYFVKSDLLEDKFMKKLPKRCLGYAFDFRQNSILLTDD
jgi:hypothetical protein